ncbi:MAG: CHAT domain-containing tetratricopeptide repeat protein [Humibacillus sp.]|nr:CHAT domain-containing tetratricopeptide repeat protein [Humibacillus sp.]MDN5777416.1 CHAT domain-containing tetratricopeptide repeat protein [Humibacillus sp.]
MEPDAQPEPPDTTRRHRSSGEPAQASAIEQLLPLAISAPRLALEAAEKVLAGSTDPRECSLAHQAISIVLRDRGEVKEAVRHGRLALRLAQRVGADRQGEVLATLGVTLFYAGRTREALCRFDEAIPLTDAAGLPRLWQRRGHVLGLLARHEEALHDLTLAITGSHEAGDVLWEARSLNNRSDVYLSRGEAGPADRDAVAAERLFSGIGQQFEAAQAQHNRALAALQNGDLPEALTLIDDVNDRYLALGNVRHDLVIDHARTLLAAGLNAEAGELVVEALRTPGLSPVRRAELLLVGARASLGQGHASAAATSADAASRLFASQRRAGWAARALLLRLRARHLADHPDLQPLNIAPVGEPPPATPVDARRTARMLRDSTALIGSLRRSDSPDLPMALLLHGRIAHEAGRHAEAQASLVAASASRSQGPPLGRAAGWLAAALLARHRDDRRALYAACRRGLDAIDEHRSSLGDVELRALASAHGLELAQLAVTEAVRSGRPRQVLWWTERWRAAALAGPARQPDDPGLRRDLAALRDVARRLASTDDLDLARPALGRERSRLESAVSRRYRHLRAEPAPRIRRSTASGSTGLEDVGAAWSAAGPDLQAVIDALGDDGMLLAPVNDRGTLHLVSVSRGRVSRRVVGPAEQARREAEFARFTLRRAAHARTVALAATAARLQSALLGVTAPPLLRAESDRPGIDPERPAPLVVVVPPADLLTAPWGLLPAFRDVSLTVSPSASQWLRAKQTSGARDGPVALVTGPGLTTREEEVGSLRHLHTDTRVLGSAQATVAATLLALDGAGLAHIAAHGSFRADAPLFSSLALADGPLNVHDLQGLRHPPRSVVLSACDSGGAAPIGPFEALGLVNSLLAMGVSDVLASVVPVNDVATLEVMTHVHRVAAAGGSLAEGWLQARRALADDPLGAATAASFTAWGG